MTDQERSLLDAIRDDPDDDALRLVYADWLEENGRSDQAELLRLQLYLDDEKMTTKGLEREKELSAKLSADWPAELRQAGVFFRRGVAVVGWENVARFQQGTALIESAGEPAWIVERRLELSWSNDEEIAGLVEQPGYGRLTRFEINSRSNITAATAKAIASSPLSVGLRQLSLNHASIGPVGAKALAKSPRLGRLRGLGFFCTPLGDTGVAAIMNSKTLCELQGLGLCASAEGEDIARALAAGTGLPKLKRINLCMNKIGDARLRRLLKASWMRGLRSLELHSNAIRDSGAKAMAECEALRGLKELHLNSTQLGDEGAIALLESPHLQGLEELTVGFCRKISEPVRQRIKKRFGRTGEVGKGRANVWS